MEYLLKKLNYKDQDRICVVNSYNGFISGIRNARPSLKVDREIDPKFLYEFCIVFVKSEKDLRNNVADSIHNLAEDGVLWFAYPKKSSKKYKSALDRNHGWEQVNGYGFEPVRQVSIDDDWTALRFRNVKFIKRKNRE